MKKPAALTGTHTLTEENPGWRAAWCRFWFAPRDAFGLHMLRVLAGLLFLAWLLPFAGQVEAFFSLNGWFDAQAYIDASRLPDVARPYDALGWSLFFIPGVDPNLLYWVFLGGIALFTLGIATRLTGVLTFAVVVSFTANPVISYDADRLLPILAFYLMVGYLLLGQSWRGLSLGQRLLGVRGISVLSRSRQEEPPSIAANLALRLFQVHFAFLVVMMGLDKLQVGDWWSGTAFWYWLYPAGTTLEAARARAGDAQSYLTFMSLGVYAVLAWQIGFPLFAWRRGWRLVLLGGAVIGWIGLAMMCGLPLFGPILLIACLSYLTPEEWQRWFGFLGKFRRGAATPARQEAAARKESKETALVP